MEAIKRIRSLQQKKYRDREGAFLVQGRKAVEELLRSSFEVLSVHVRRGSSLPAEALTPPWFERTEEDMARIGTLSTGNEIVAVARIPGPHKVSAIGASELILAFDGVSDPGNMGTLLRIADWFGVEQVLCSTDCVDVYNPKCVQASMGSLFRVAVEVGDLPERSKDLREKGCALYLADMAGIPVQRAELTRPAVLVMGSESHGLSSGVRGSGGALIAVPRVGRAESLNVAMAASALCMEFHRQAEAFPRTP